MLLLLVLLFIVVPIAELAVIIQVGQAIGVWWTIALLIADALLGSWLMRYAGPRRLAALQRGRLRRAACPTREVLDGALVIFGGALLLTPGLHHRHPRPACCCSRRTRALVRADRSCAGSRTAMVASATRARTTPGVTTTSRAPRSTSTPSGSSRGPGPARRDRRVRGARPAPPRSPGFTDAVTFSFGDPARGSTGSRATRPARRRRRARERAGRAVRRRASRSARSRAAGIRADAGFEHLDLPACRPRSASRSQPGPCASTRASTASS